MDLAVLMLQTLTLLILGYLLRSYFPTYFQEKAKNLATKEDIEDITRKVEAVKAEVSQSARKEEVQYKLKYEACLEALSIIDAYFSHALQSPGGTLVIPQHASTEKARECHSKLILSCEDTRILELFSEIVFGPSPGQHERKPPTDLLNDFRNLVRKELGFGQKLPLDRERAWIAMMNSDPQKNKALTHDGGTDTDFPQLP